MMGTEYKTTESWYTKNIKEQSLGEPKSDRKKLHWNSWILEICAMIFSEKPSRGSCWKLTWHLLPIVADSLHMTHLCSVCLLFWLSQGCSCLSFWQLTEHVKSQKSTWQGQNSDILFLAAKPHSAMCIHNYAENDSESKWNY